MRRRILFDRFLFYNSIQAALLCIGAKFDDGTVVVAGDVCVSCWNKK